VTNSRHLVVQRSGECDVSGQGADAPPPRLDPTSELVAPGPGCLQRALTPGSRRLRTGRGAHWRPASVRTLCEGTGHFVGYLVSVGVDFGTTALLEFCTTDRVWAWIDAMRARELAPATIKTRVVGLQRIMAVMHPFESWRWLYDIVTELPDGLLESRRRKMPK